MSHRVRSGLSRLTTDEQQLVHGRRIGLLCHHASFTDDLEFAPYALERAGATVVRIFGPEHGPWGTAQDMIPVDGGRDDWTGYELVSLYGQQEESLTPESQMFDGLDLLVVDLQDVGSRYYTYAATAALAIRVARDAGVDVLVCDRPNPIGGLKVEGGRVLEAYRSFVGRFDVPIRHGLTFAELVAYYLDWPELPVVKMAGWHREMWFDDTGLPWIPPSPNMPSLETATVYPGQCLLEGTTLSEGRGTTTPFEVFGAPWVEPFRFVESLKDYSLPGVTFRPHVFEPTFQKHARTPCGGAQMIVFDREQFMPVLTGITVLCALRAHDEGAFTWRTERYEYVTDRLAIDLLFGDPAIRLAIEGGHSPQDIASELVPYTDRFVERARSFRMYA
jgi:uncharacterized protein YbbC (DUF1343 family)